MKKLIAIVMLFFVTSIIIADEEFNAYEYSKKFKSWIFDGSFYKGPFSLLNNQLKLDFLVSFSKDDLRLLRNCIYARYDYKFTSLELKNFFSKFKYYKGDKDNVDDQFTENDKKNIKIIQEIENNLPSTVNTDNIVGVWREYGAVPDQGYVWGDYIIMYPNGIFEYKKRNFNAIRYGKEIFGGSRYGLWTIKNIPVLKNEVGIEYITIGELKKSGYNDDINETIIYNKRWWFISNNIFEELDWGTW